MISSWTFFWLVGGEVPGSQHHQPSGSNRPVVSVLVDSIQLTSSTWWGLQCLQNSSGIANVCPLRRNWDPAPSWGVFTAPALPLHPLPSVISNCLSLSFLRNSGKVMEAEWSLFPTSKKWGTRKDFCVQEPHRGLLGFSFFSSNVFPLWLLPDTHLQTGMGLWWNFHLSVANWEIKKKRTVCELLIRLGLFNFKDCLLFWGNDLPFGVKMFFLLWNDYES